MENFPRKFIGKVGFINADETIVVKNVIHRSETELSIEFAEDFCLYTVNLKSTDGIYFSGEWIARRDNEVDEGRVNAVLYSAGEEKLLFGNWFEEGEKLLWWIALEVNDETE